MKSITRPKKTIFYATISVMLCQTIYMFYVTSRSVVLHTILSDLGGMSYYSITVILSSMTMAVTTPLAGKLGDMFGRKRIYVIGLLGYCMALLMCALATSPLVFMIAIAFVGITYGLSYPQMISLLVEIYEPQQCPKMLGYISLASAVSSLIGPVIGGLCVDFVGWRLVFIVMLPFSVVNALCAIAGMPNVAPTAKDSKVDYKGTFLFASCMVPFLYLLTAAGSQFSWISAPTLLLLLITLVSFVLLIQEEKRTTNPIVPLVLFKKPIFTICIIITILSGLCFSGMNYLPIYYQMIKGMTSTASGMITIPRQCAMMIASVFTGHYIARQKNYKLGTIVPMALFFVELMMMSRFAAATSIILICIAELLFGVANGALTVTPNAIGQHYLSNKEMGSGIAFISFASTFGNSLGAAVMGCIISQFWNVRRVLPDNLYQALSSEHISALTSTATMNSPEALETIRMTLSPDLWLSFDKAITALKEAFTQGFNLACFIYVVLIGLAMVLLLKFSWKKDDPCGE